MTLGDRPRSGSGHRRETGSWWNGGFAEGRQSDLLAEPLELTDEATDVGVGRVAPEQELGAELRIGLAPVEDVVGDDEQGVGDREGRPAGTPPAGEAGVPGGEGGSLWPRCGLGRRPAAAVGWLRSPPRPRERPAAPAPRPRSEL